jgi:hypothetical protein
MALDENGEPPCDGAGCLAFAMVPPIAVGAGVGALAPRTRWRDVEPPRPRAALGLSFSLRF